MACCLAFEIAAYHHSWIRQVGLAALRCEISSTCAYGKNSDVDTDVAIYFDIQKLINYVGLCVIFSKNRTRQGYKKSCRSGLRHTLKTPVAILSKLSATSTISWKRAFVSAGKERAMSYCNCIIDVVAFPTFSSQIKDIEASIHSFYLSSDANKVSGRIGS